MEDIFLVFINLIFFLLLSAICFTIHGAFFLERSHAKLSFWQKIIIGTVVGLIFFSLLSYLLSVIKLHFLLIPLILLINLFSIKSILALRQQVTLMPKKKLISLILVFILGVLGQMLIIAPSGTFLNGDLIFWSSHGHDGLWHIALMEEYKKGYPLQNPVFGGEKLVNYHFFSDIAPADFNNYFKLPTLDLYFRFFPLLYSLLLGSLAYFVGVKLGGSFASGIWATIFTYFAGSFGYVVTYLQNKTIGGEALFWVSQPQSIIGNPPQVVAFIIILAFLYLFSIFINNRNKVLFLICTLLAGSLAAFKIYGAVVVLISLALVGIWQAVTQRKIHNLVLFLASSLLGAFLYFPNSSNTGSFLIFEPWWFIRTMVVAPDRLNLIDWELKRQTYLKEGNFKRVIQIEVQSFLIFLFGNLGMRFLGFYTFTNLIKKSFKDYFHLLLILVSIISFVFPLLFLQKGVAGNTIQFFQYFLLLFGIFAGVSLTFILGKLKYKKIAKNTHLVN